LKLPMAKNSLFAILLRSPWWVSFAIAAGLALLGGALLPDGYRVVGAMSSLPFVVIGVLAARRQWQLPGAAQVARTQEAVAALAWPAFAGLLEQAFVRDGYEVRSARSAAGSKDGGKEGSQADAGADFALERRGRTMLVSARRWKTARTGVAPLRALQEARDAAEAPDALYIGLGDFTDGARAFAAEHRIAVWQAAELAQAMKGLPLPPARPAAGQARAGQR
jgi:restriction system protein